MALRLRVVSEHAIRLGERSTKVFGVHGGTIGRATNNEWSLPDPERYLSGKHARVDFRAGTYVLVDTSSNGTYLNGAQVPLGKFHEYALKDGDYVRLGQYELLVSIDKSNDFPPEEGAIVAYDGQSPSAAAKKSTANDLGADLDLSELLEPSDQAAVDSGVRPRDAYGQSLPRTAPPPPRASATPELESDDAGTPWHMLTRPLKVSAAKADSAATPTSAPAPAPASAPLTAARSLSLTLHESGEFDAGLTAFCRGAGIDPRLIGAEVRGAVLQLAGQLLRESVLGLMDLNQSRNEFRNRFRIAPAPSEGGESPLNFSQGVDEVLMRLITTLSVRSGSVVALRSNFRELKAQNTAAFSATRTAFEEFLGRVDPKELEERFDRASKRGVFGSQNRAKYWELYGEMFAGLAQRPADGFPHLFTETFAKAFEAKFRTLVPPQRSTFGADRSDEKDPGDQAVGDL
ncbi:MAG TPA: type VI secretion system-associated FHA domain protein TagH [Steroidobacteraceae bacterium]